MLWQFFNTVSACIKNKSFKDIYNSECHKKKSNESGNSSLRIFFFHDILQITSKSLYITKVSCSVRNAISKLYNAVSAPVTAIRDALVERFESVPETASFLYNRMPDNIGYEREKLKGIVKKEANKESKEKQQNDYDEKYGTVPKIKLVNKGKCVKGFIVIGNLIMIKITLHIEMRTNVIYFFKSEIHRGACETSDYNKTLTLPPRMFKN